MRSDNYSISKSYSQSIDSLVLANVGSDRPYYLILFLTFVVLCIPIWAVNYLPLVDYPNHLARMVVLHEYEHEPAFQASYNRSIKPLPNLAMDLIVPVLMNVLPGNPAGKVFLTVALFLFCFGSHALGVTLHGRPTWMAIPCCFVFYNSMLFYGFVNYMFGCSMFLITLAWWLRQRSEWKLHTWLIAACLVLVSYMSHLSAYLFLAGAFVVTTLGDYYSNRQYKKGPLIGLSTLLPPTVLFLQYAQSGGETKHIYWNGVYKKTIALAAPFLSYDYRADLVIFISVVIVAIIALRRVEYFTARGVGILIATVLGLGFIVCPEGVFQVSGADARFVLPATVLLSLSLRFKISRRFGILTFAVLISLFVVRLVNVYQVWRSLDEEIGKQVAMFNVMPRGSRVYPIVFLPHASQANKTERPYIHVIHYSTLYQHSFVPSIFAIKGQQPITLKKEAVFFHEYHDQQPSPEHVDWEEILKDYDFIWCYNINNEYHRWLKRETELIDDNGKSKIFRIFKK